MSAPAPPFEIDALDPTLYVRGVAHDVFRWLREHGPWSIFLEQRGCKAQVKQKVSAATAQLIDKPPFPFAWIPATPMDEVESALSLVAGRDACVDLGLTAARKLGGSLIQPVLRRTYWSLATVNSPFDR